MLNSSVQDCKTAVTFAPTLIEKHLQSASGVKKKHLNSEYCLD